MNAEMPKDRIQFYLDKETHQILKRIADNETRTVPNVVERLIDEALVARGLKIIPPLEVTKD